MNREACDSHDHSDGIRLQIDEEVCVRAAAIFRALGDPGRLKLLVLLSQHETCVTDIANALDERMTTVSQRLRLLKSERLVKSRREGKHLFYTLADSHVAGLVENAMDHAQENDD